MARQSNKPKNPQMRFPKGVAQYPHLNKPDTKFNSEGEYTVSLVYDLHSEEAQDAQKKLDAIAAQFESEADEEIHDLHIPYIIDEEAGTLTVKFKQKAFFYEGKKILPKPAFFDAKGKPMEEIPLIRGGSELKAVAGLRYTVMTETDRKTKKKENILYVSIQPKAFQIISISEGGGGNFGFEEEEGFSQDEGYEAFKDDVDAADEGSEFDEEF